MPSLPDAIVPMNCFGDLPASWHPADQGAAFTVGCGGIKQDIGFRFRAGTGVCPVPETIDPQPLLQPVETVEPREHGKGAAECAGFPHGLHPRVPGRRRCLDQPHHCHPVRLDLSGDRHVAGPRGLDLRLERVRTAGAGVPGRR